MLFLTKIRKISTCFSPLNCIAMKKMVLLLLFLFSLTYVKAQQLSHLLAARVDSLFAEYTKPGSPGCAVAVVQNNQVVYSKGYGLASLEYDVPNTPNTVFHVASDSKRFTAMALVLLAQDGKLSLEDDIRKHLPEVPDFGKTITVRHLANHTSGLRDQWALLALAGWRLDDVITRDHIMKLVTRQQELNFAPGEEHLYCNTGYSLMAEIVERVSGEPFRVFLQKRVFAPLQMNNTEVHDDHERVVKGRAYSYHSDANGYKNSVLSYANQGATSLFTTAEDLAKWVINYNSGSFEGNPQVYQELSRPGVLNKGDTIDYALGMKINKHKGLKLVGHGGADAGFRSFVGSFPEQQFGVVVLGNLASFNAFGKAMKIADIFLKDQLKPEDPVPVAKTAPKAKKTAKKAKPAPKLFDYYTGSYQLNPRLTLHISREGDKMFVEPTGQGKFEIFPESLHRFYLKVVDAQLTFSQKGKEKAPELVLHQNGQDLPAPRVEPFVPTEEALERLVGKYYSEELGTTYQIVLRDGKLLATHQRHPDVSLLPTAENEVAGNTWWFGQVKFTRTGSGKPDGFLMDNGRCRNVRFKRI